MTVTPNSHKRLNATEARARFSALHRDPAFVQRFLADEAGARREISRLLRVIDRAEKDARAKSQLRFARTIKNIGEDTVSRLSWLVQFSQLRLEDFTLVGLNDLQAFAEGPFAVDKRGGSRKGLGPMLRWPHLERGRTREALARFAYDKLREFFDGGTSILAADHGRLEIRIDRFDGEAVAHFEGAGAAAFAMEVARVLTEEGMRLRKCASQSCGRFFVQRKRGRFCSTRCSHRERQRTWHDNLSPDERYKERFARYVKSADHTVKPRGPRKPTQEKL